MDCAVFVFCAEEYGLPINGHVSYSIHRSDLWSAGSGVNAVSVIKLQSGLKYFHFISMDEFNTVNVSYCLKHFINVY